jgi:predicted O-linked N-acetylglucosamine transferase (SPINDLY family)
MHWALSVWLPSATTPEQRQQRLARFGQFLYSRFPNRPDLLLQLIQHQSATAVLKSLPNRALDAGSYYSNSLCSLFHFQELWLKGRYSQLYSTYAGYHLHRRPFPHSDFLLRALTIVGSIERMHALFRQIHQRHRAELTPITLSNMLFTALGLEQLDQDHVAELVQQFKQLTDGPGTLAPDPPRRRQRLQVNEKPLIAVASADLRMHPVGRFWLPIARQLSQRYRVVYLAGNPHDRDGIRSELQSLAHAWVSHDDLASEEILAATRKHQPQLLLDLGGHTADNRPQLLSRRHAPVQATYLGFYGPTYASQCDWWILDAAIAQRVQGSYPGSEAIWSLPGPSLCYDPSSHGLPEPGSIAYTSPDHPVIGSFNHTRKLTAACLQRFAAVLAGLPEAVLMFRSHSFFDQGVRHWFLQRLLDAGVDPAQLLPIPYAPTAADSLRDYGRIHLHLDSYPVSGTTTTLDSLCMGIPVLTCPNNLYAGAISAAILEQAGFPEWVAEHPDQLPAKAAELCRTYRTAAARRALADRMRRSSLCDTIAMPRMFADQVGEMLRAASLKSSPG